MYILYMRSNSKTITEGSYDVAFCERAHPRPVDPLDTGARVSKSLQLSLSWHDPQPSRVGVSQTQSQLRKNPNRTRSIDTVLSPLTHSFSLSGLFLGGKCFDGSDVTGRAAMSHRRRSLESAGRQE